MGGRGASSRISIAADDMERSTRLLHNLEI